MTLTIQSPVGSLVADRPSRSRVFQKLGIDFCCGGKKSLDEACRKKGLNPQSVLQTLLASEETSPDMGANPLTMTLTELCDHIEKVHHGYLKEELPRLGAMVRKVAAVHGLQHPWTLEVDGVFAGFSAALESHMLKEEHALFPLIREIESNAPTALKGHVERTIVVMEHEHDDAGNALARLRALTSDFTPPPAACNTFRAMLDGLEQLEADMHHHVHKENNVLFPRAIQAEQSAAGDA